jgi:hypothetical protein
MVIILSVELPECYSNTPTSMPQLILLKVVRSNLVTHISYDIMYLELAKADLTPPFLQVSAMKNIFPPIYLRG